MRVYSQTLVDGVWELKIVKFYYHQLTIGSRLSKAKTVFFHCFFLFSMNCFDLFQPAFGGAALERWSKYTPCIVIWNFKSKLNFLSSEKSNRLRLFHWYLFVLGQEKASPVKKYNQTCSQLRLKLLCILTFFQPFFNLFVHFKAF